MRDYPVSQRKMAGSALKKPDDSSCDSGRERLGTGSGEADPAGEERRPGESDCYPDREVRVELQGSELWNRFYEIGTEMIITKAGR